MSTFSQLMAISRTQTEQVQSTVEAAKAQRQRKEELRRKQQEERERHERELEAKLRAEHFEKQKKERERLKRLEQERSAKELELARREEQQREALMHGPNRKKAASSIASDDSAPQWPSSSRRSRDEVRRARLPLDDDRDSRSGSPSLALTREEKRQRKLEADLRRSLGVGKRTPPKNVRRNGRLPGGALDVTATASQSSADTPPSSQSVKARIAAIPNTLTKLNVVKRDTRTIDEILQDRAKARDCKVLDGDQAREFNDWFGSSKKKDTNGTTVSPPAPNSGANTPTSQSSSNSKYPRQQQYRFPFYIRPSLLQEVPHLLRLTKLTAPSPRPLLRSLPVSSHTEPF
jgi:protein SPT2